MLDPFLIEDDERLTTVLEDRIEEGLKDRSYFLIVTAATTKLISRQRITIAPRERERGRMGLMSVRSKNRLLYKCNLIDWQACGRTSFLTLTFPDDKWPARSSRRTMYRSWFMRELERKIGRPQATLWRQEWEVRKTGRRAGTYVSHFHMIMPGMPWVDKWWIKETWMNILGEKSNADTDIIEVHGIDAVIRYLAAYLSGLGSLDIVSYLNTEAEFGRPWGFTREELIPLLPVLFCRALDPVQVGLMADMVRGVRREYDPEKDGGFTLLGRFFSTMALSLLSDGA
jgi:hypothetical protein